MAEPPPDIRVEMVTGQMRMHRNMQACMPLSQPRIRVPFSNEALVQTRSCWVMMDRCRDSWRSRNCSKVATSAKRSWSMRSLVPQLQIELSRSGGHDGRTRYSHGAYHEFCDGYSITRPNSRGAGAGSPEPCVAPGPWMNVRKGARRKGLPLPCRRQSWQDGRFALAGSVT